VFGYKRTGGNKMVENRVGQISEWFQVQSMPEVRNLTGEISELIYMDAHPEESESNE
jgi:hypothetical protein